MPEVKAAIRQVEKELSGKGILLVRYSGTQPQCRVMVKGRSLKKVKLFSQQIAEAIKSSIV